MRPVIFRTGSKYPENYETALKNMTRVYTGEECYVLNDQNRKYPYPGWWGKMELFSPELKHLRPFLFFDLDTLILKNIEDMVTWIPQRLWMLEDAYQKGHGQSAIMAIPENTDAIWNKWSENPQKWMQMPGDQDFLRLFKPGFLQDKFNGIHSYKADNCYENPKGRIVFFHGKPKPHECTGWAGEYFRSQAS